MSKTPVSALQELLVQNGSLPVYDLIESVTLKGNIPRFKIRVSGLGFKAEGVGSSKQDAKHAAAKELLCRLSPARRNLFGSCESSTNESVSNTNGVRDFISPGIPISNSYSPRGPILNSVGCLQEHCVASYKSTLPKYEELQAGNMFLIKCIVAHHSTIGEGRTKKEAKHNSARLMLIELKGDTNFEPPPQKVTESLLLKPPGQEVVHKVEHPPLKDPKKEKEEHERRMEIISRLLQERLQFCKNNSKSSVIEDRFVKYFKNEAFLKSAEMRELKGKIIFAKSIADPLNYFKRFLESLGYRLNTSIINRTNDLIVMLLEVIDCDLRPTFVGCGSTYDNARDEAALKALEWYAIMSASY